MYTSGTKVNLPIQRFNILVFYLLWLYSFEDTVIGDSYLNMLEGKNIPELQNSLLL